LIWPDLYPYYYWTLKAALYFLFLSSITTCQKTQPQKVISMQKQIDILRMCFHNDDIDRTEYLEGLSMLLAIKNWTFVFSCIVFVMSFLHGIKVCLLCENLINLFFWIFIFLNFYLSRFCDIIHILHAVAQEKVSTWGDSVTLISLQPYPHSHPAVSFLSWIIAKTANRVIRELFDFHTHSKRCLHHYLATLQSVQLKFSPETDYEMGTRLG
jgi:hypothetical protein